MENQNDYQLPPKFPEVTKGMEIDDFVLQEKIGQGGMGEVWLAYQISMDREVALKILSSDAMQDPLCVRRFINEIKNQGKIVHPNVILAIKAGESNNVGFLAMRYVYGVDLQQKVDSDGPIKEKKALKLLLPIIDALEYAWEKYKVIHRDIKPSNIIIDKHGEPMLLDLGISKSFAEGTSLSLTDDGQFMGTPDFVSPEQIIRDKRVDFRTDIYALGATLYLLTTGTPPYEGETALAVMSKQITEDFPDPRESNPKLSNNFADLIKIMTAKDPKFRHSSWNDVKMDFQRVIRGQPCKKSFVLPSKKETEKKNLEKLSKKVEQKTNPLVLPIGILLIIIAFLAGCILGLFLGKDDSEIKKELNREEEKRKELMDAFLFLREENLELKKRLTEE